MAASSPSALDEAVANLRATFSGAPKEIEDPGAVAAIGRFDLFVKQIVALSWKAARHAHEPSVARATNAVGESILQLFYAISSLERTR